MSARTAREQRRAARAAKRRTQRLIVAAGALVILAVVALVIYSALTADRRASDPQSEDLVVGTGDEAQIGDTVSVHYTGWLEDGTQFDSSIDRGQPFDFTIGQGGVIPGWDQGVPGMRVGGTRRLTIPPDLAYGPTGSGPIPPNATLIFEIQLLEIR
jgi:FKBP-type peptidyl-prolyl cis-trans isomerase FkpA